MQPHTNIAQGLTLGFLFFSEFVFSNMWLYKIEHSMWPLRLDIEVLIFFKKICKSHSIRVLNLNPLPLKIF